MGVITYEMFAGKTPFLGDTLQAIMTGHLFTEPPRLEDVPKNLGVPKPIAEIIDRMLVKDANDRYGSAADVLADLRDVNKNREPTVADSLAKEKPSRTSSPKLDGRAQRDAADEPAPAKRPVGTIVGVTLAAVAVAGGLLYWKTTSQHKPVDTAAVTKPAPDTTPKPVPPAPAPEKPIDYDQVRKDAETTLRASIKEAEPATRVQGADALGKIRISRRCRRSPT